MLPIENLTQRLQAAERSGRLTADTEVDKLRQLRGALQSQRCSGPTM